MTEKSTDHAERGIAKLLEQFKRSPRLIALLRSYLNQIQKLENAIWEVILIRGIEASEGVGLDQIGRIVGRQRLGLSDSDYRIALRAQIRINRSSGRPEDLLDVTALSISDSFTIDYNEYYPATVIIFISGAVDFNVSILFQNLIKTKCGGIRLFLSYSLEDPEHTFTFASGSSPELDTDRGFGSLVDSSIGGVWSNVLSST